jgi:UDP:flavonoid glycosyltransferase YjiC (YdhE family)
VTIVFYISGHGLGHASRSIELLKVLAARRPDVRLVVRTAAPLWLFRATAPKTVELATVDTDVGVVQIDSLNVDADETALRAAHFYGTFAERTDAEAAFLTAERASIVLGDIPPLAFAAAARSNIPSVAIGNFTWDWIYAGYETFDSVAPGVVDIIRDAYASATRALRLPLHGGFEPMAAVTIDIPFIARRATHDAVSTRRVLGIADDRPFVLASFGSYGLKVPYEAIAASERLTVLDVEREPPATLTYPDLVAAADVVISKPGYGIVSECVANRTALLYTSRGRFIEYDVFVAEMPRLLRCRHLPQADLLAGRWSDSVRDLLAQPEAPQQPRVDGAEFAATEILNLLVGSIA